MAREVAVATCAHDQEKPHWYDAHNATHDGSHIVFEMEDLPDDKPMRYCAGPERSWPFEAWRSQLEFQMEHSPPLRSLAVDTTTDRLSQFVPLGWTAAWGERWYDVPIYNAVVDHHGFDPLFQRDVRNRALS